MERLKEMNETDDYVPENLEEESKIELDPNADHDNDPY